MFQDILEGVIGEESAALAGGGERDAEEFEEVGGSLTIVGSDQIGGTESQKYNVRKGCCPKTFGAEEDMPALSTNEAAERLAKIVEQAKATALTETYAELLPEKPWLQPRPRLTSQSMPDCPMQLLRVPFLIRKKGVVFPIRM